MKEMLAFIEYTSVSGAAIMKTELNVPFGDTTLLFCSNPAVHGIIET